MTTATIAHSAAAELDHYDVLGELIDHPGTSVYYATVRSFSVPAVIEAVTATTAKIAKRLPGLTTTVHTAPAVETRWCTTHRAWAYTADAARCGLGPSEAHPNAARCYVVTTTGTVVDVRAEGLPVFDGDWAVAGVLTRDAGGAIVATTVGVMADQEGFARDYADRMGTCDHCRKTRARATTILLTDGVEVRAVGKSCLTEYTGGAIRVEVLAVLTELGERFATAVGGFLADLGHDYLAPVVDVVALAGRIITAVGFVRSDEWQRTPTATEIRNAIGYDGKGQRPLLTVSDLTEADRAAARADIALILDRSIDTDRDMESDFLSNLRAVAEAEWTQWAGKRNRIGLLAALPGAADRRREFATRQAAQAEATKGLVNDWIGAPTQRREFTGKLVVNRLVDTAYGNVDLVKIETPEGLVKVFGKFYAVRDIEIGTEVTITATIKDHGEWQGRRETIVNRAKLG